MNREAKRTLHVSLSLPSGLATWLEKVVEQDQRTYSNYITKMLWDKMIQEQAQNN